jgi:hypothetical protein
MNASGAMVQQKKGIDEEMKKTVPQKKSVARGYTGDSYGAGSKPIQGATVAEGVKKGMPIKGASAIARAGAMAGRKRPMKGNAK